MVMDSPRSNWRALSWDTGWVTAQAEPTPKPAKPRLLHDGRDMFWSIAPLVAACIVLAGLVGTCSFRPGGPSTGPVPSFDAAAALSADAQTLGFPIRLPKPPPHWQANSGGRGSIDDGRIDVATGQRSRAVTSTVGYLTPAGMYMRVTQSNADETKLMDWMHPVRSAQRPTGTINVDDTRWVVYEGDAEPVWTTRLDGPAGAAQLAVTGAGSPDDFRVLAAATQSQSPLPAAR